MVAHRMRTEAASRTAICTATLRWGTRCPTEGPILCTQTDTLTGAPLRCPSIDYHLDHFAVLPAEGWHSAFTAWQQLLFSLVSACHEHGGQHYLLSLCYRAAVTGGDSCVGSSAMLLAMRGGEQPLMACRPHTGHLKARLGRMGTWLVCLTAGLKLTLLLEALR